MDITFTLHWWIIPIGLFLLGIIGFFVIANMAGDYDCFTPLAALAFGALFIGGSIFFIVGHFIK